MTRFQNKDGQWVYLLDGQEVSEEQYFSRLESGKGEDPAALIVWKPIQSRALAVHPQQVAQANARSKRHSLGVEYAPDGTAILSSRNNRKRLLKVEGMHDESGGYGD